MKYTLPDLGYDYSALEPHVSARIMELHHSAHHAGYVKGANATLEKLAEARAVEREPALSLHRDLAFHVAGHVLHSIFWKSMSPCGGGEPEGALAEAVGESFGDALALRREMSAAARAVQGSGWAVLAWEPLASRLVVQAVQDHQMQHVPGARPVLALDVWEHAYYLQYQNRRDLWVDAFWNVVDWTGALERLAAIRTDALGPTAASHVGD